MTNGQRIKIKSGERTKGFILVAPPFPEIGDTIRFEGENWQCIASEPEQIMMVYRHGLPFQPAPGSNPEPPARRGQQRLYPALPERTTNEKVKEKLRDLALRQAARQEHRRQLNEKARDRKRGIRPPAPACQIAMPFNQDSAFLEAE